MLRTVLIAFALDILTDHVITRVGDGWELKVYDKAVVESSAREEEAGLVFSFLISAFGVRLRGRQGPGRDIKGEAFGQHWPRGV
jgi:hypothetical protein